MVKLYTQEGCPDCRRVESFFKRNNVAFEVLNIREDEAALNRVKELGYTGTPVIEANGQHWKGYDPEKLVTLK